MRTGAHLTAQAHAQAGEYQARIRDQLDVACQEDTPGCWRATIHAPHPAAADITTTVRAIARSRAGAIEAARSELYALAVRCFADERAAKAEAAGERDGHLYASGVRGLTRVRAAVAQRGGREPAMADVDQAALTLHVEDGVREPTIGQVADRVLERQGYRPLVAARAPLAGQGALL